MKKKNLLTLLILFVFTFLSCSDDDRENSLTQNEQGFTLSYFVDNSTLTRSSIDLEEGEDQINSLYVLFFENTIGGTGLFVEGIDAMASYNGTLSNSGNLRITFPENSSLNNSQSYTMLLCANLERYTDINRFQDIYAYCIGKTENEVKLLLQQISGVAPGSGEEEINTNQILSAHLPMSSRLVKEANVREVIAELVRTVVRFDVYMQTEKYKLVSASIWNAYTEGYVWEGNITDYQAPRTERFYGVKTTNNKIVGSLYSFENFVRESEQGDKVSTCLILGLENQSTRKVEYFRTNVNVSEISGQQIKRNNVYTTIVKGVSRTGYDTERDAYEGDESRLLNISFSQTEIKVSTTGTTNTATFDILSNGNWDAEVIVERGTQAGFNTSYTQQTISGSGNVSNLKVYVPAYNGNKPSRIIVRATIRNTNISADLLIYQNPSFTGEMFITTAAFNTSLADSTSANYTLFIYNLGENMRNTSLFGAGGELVDMPYGGFYFKQSTDINDMRAARFIQFVTTNTTTTGFNNAYAEHQADPSKFLMFSSNSYSIPNELLKTLQKKGELGYGTVGTVENEVENYRGVYQKGNNLEHPLMKYLLDGPAGRVNPDEIMLQSGNNWHSGGLQDKDWPSTFVPIIKSTNSFSTSAAGKDYCVFGIDPVNRLILIMDSSIFGSISNPSKLGQYPNQLNYADPESANSIFLNNFIAWMARVAVEGEEFLSQFQIR